MRPFQPLPVIRLETEQIDDGSPECVGHDLHIPELLHRVDEKRVGVVGKLYVLSERTDLQEIDVLADFIEHFYEVGGFINFQSQLQSLELLHNHETVGADVLQPFAGGRNIELFGVAAVDQLRA